MKSKRSAPCPGRRETIGGFWYLAFQTLLLPGLLRGANRALGLNPAELNFLFFLINFLAASWIFHDLLGKSAKQAIAHPAYFCQAVILGAAAYFACSWVIKGITQQLAPGFSNANDAAIAQLGSSSFLLTFLGTVVLVPTTEECLYRGLIFRNLYNKSPAAAYLISTLVFALVHMVGYLGQYTLLETVLAFLQYLPAGLWLAWAYLKGGSIFAPILIHTLVNALGMTYMR